MTTPKQEVVNQFAAMSPEELQKTLVAFKSYKDTVIKKFYEDWEQLLDAAGQANLLNTYFEQNGTTYKMVAVEGQYVHFNRFNVNCTKREGEERGSLAATEAKSADAAGLVVHLK